MTIREKLMQARLDMLARACGAASGALGLTTDQRLGVRVVLERTPRSGQVRGARLTFGAVRSEVIMGVRRHRRYSTEFELQLVEAYLAGEGTAKGLVRSRGKRCRLTIAPRAPSAGRRAVTRGPERGGARLLKVNGGYLLARRCVSVVCPPGPAPPSGMERSPRHPHDDA